MEPVGRRLEDRSRITAERVDRVDPAPPVGIVAIVGEQHLGPERRSPRWIGCSDPDVQ
jgi:hypothetical protein